MTQSKRKIGLLFGGRSSEHQVSIISARSVLKAVDRDKFDIELICITPEGKWISGANAEKLLTGKKADTSEDTLLPPFPGENKLLTITQNEKGFTVGGIKGIDVFFPLLHGTFGEDGTIQGLLELSGTPYVGAGVAASAVGMDKILMKNVFSAHNLPVVESLNFLRSDWKINRLRILDKTIQKLGLPLFVKPANTGSSVGVSKAHDIEELGKTVDYAAQFDRKILIERYVNAREIECSVLGNDNPEASVPGEIIPSNEFYDYDAKYINESSKLIIPAELDIFDIARIRGLSVKAYKSIDCAGMARVDFLLEHDTNKIYINEINTIPGFTPISMYPKLWEESGISYGELITKLIELAVERNIDRKNCKTTYEPAK